MTNAAGDQSGGARGNIDDNDSTSMVTRGSTETVDAWSDTYTSARDWVELNARRRWPDFPCNDEIWAMSVTAWWLGDGRVRRG
jgi:hypothetical protein